MIIPNAYNYDIHLNNNQKKEILSELNTQRSFQQQYLNCWFKKYIEKLYNHANCVDDIDTQSEHLSINFCRQHGINFWKLSRKVNHNNYTKKRNTYTPTPPSKNEIIASIIIYTIVFITILTCLL